MEVKLTKLANKQLVKCPEYIQLKFDYWVDLISTIGILESRKYKGYHDEPLKGKRRGQRSVRLSKSYRAIYKQIDSEKFEVIEVLEVNKHEY